LFLRRAPCDRKHTASSQIPEFGHDLAPGSDRPPRDQLPVIEHGRRQRPGPGAGEGLESGDLEVAVGDRGRPMRDGELVSTPAVVARAWKVG